MASFIDPSFRESLLKKTEDRTAQDLTLINANLKSLEALSSLRDTTIRNLCKTVRYCKHEANDVLYRADDEIECWYILLSGSVFIDGSMYLPRSGFGRRTASQTCRIHDCLVLETSEMIVIDYPIIRQETSQLHDRQVQHQESYQELCQVPNKIKTGSNSNNQTNRYLPSNHLNNSNNSGPKLNKSLSLHSHPHALGTQNQICSNDESLGTKQNQVSVNNKSLGDNRERVCPILSANSSASSISSSLSNTNISMNHPINKNPNKHSKNASFNSSLSMHDSHVHMDTKDIYDRKNTPNTKIEYQISSDSILTNDYEKSSETLYNQTSVEKHGEEDEIATHEQVISSKYPISQPLKNRTSFVDEYNSQIKSICIITGNPSFKSNIKPKNILNQNRNDLSNSHKTMFINDIDSNNESNLRVQNIYDISNQDLDLSQHTLNSNSNVNNSVNNSVNTIDTLDIDDLRDLNNENHLNSSVNKQVSANLKTNDIQNNHCISTSINSLNSLIPTNMTTMTTTISVSGSIGDDASATSEQSLHMTKDLVREVLEKDPKERSDEDIDILFEFMQSFSAFSELSQQIVRKLCACMVLGVVDKADTLVLDHNEKLDSWAVVLNGHVECILPDSSIKSYQIGDHFGVDATLDPVYHEGIMRTMCEDCQFVLVKQNDYYEILNKSKEKLNNHTENGKLVLITEQRLLNNTSDKTGEIVLKGSIEKLVERLVYDDSYSIVDPTYIQDFLLTHRVFIENPTDISNKLYEWFQLDKVPSYLSHYSPNFSNRDNVSNQHIVKKKVYRIVLEWITNHFNDFETNKDLYEFVERFQEILNKEKMFEQFRVLTIAISTKSKLRSVTLARSKRDESLMFNIQGGWDKGYGIFVSRVEKDSKAFELGIRKGDQILEVNGHSFQHILHMNAMEMIKSFTHLSIKLKYNPIGFNELLLHPEKSPHRNKKNIVNNNKAYLIEYLQMQQNQFQNSMSTDSTDSKQPKTDMMNQLTTSVNNTDEQMTSNTILDHLQSNNNSNTNSHTKKSIGTIPPLPPGSSTTQTPRNKSKDHKMNFKSSTNGLNANNSNQSNSNQIRKILGRFNRKAHSKDLESLQPTDSSAPALKSITRSPSPSLASPFNSTNSSMFNRSYTTANINNVSASNTMTTSASVDYSPSSALLNHESNSRMKNGSSSNLNTSGDTEIFDKNNKNSLSTSLANINLQEQQQFAGEHVLKIYKNDQNFKYLVVHKETSVKEVVMLSLNEFNIIDEIGSNAYSLCEVSVDQDRLIKQKRLPDQMNNLAEKLPLNARYYLKSNVSPEQFLSDSLAVEELIKDANLNFLQLDPLELSAQLTLRDYCIFKSIESSEYIDYLFKKKSKYGFTHLNQFSDLSNEEMFWVVNEILHESNPVKRAKIIKHFIQIAHICKECKNFNSLLAILSGLDHLCVTRLKETWDKVSTKYKKILQELRILLDTTRNMHKYRQLLKSESIQPPIIPFFPICQKDLYFIKESGDTIEDGLVNFDKLRKLAKGVRSIVQMTSSSFDLTSLRDVPTSHSVIFSMFGCTNPSLIEFRSGYQYQFTKLNIKQDHVKKLYEEAVMVRKVRHYLSSISKNIEKNEERLRLISSTLEHSTSVNTLRRKPSPNNSLGGSVSSINGLNSSHNAHNISNGSTIGVNSNLSGNKNGPALFGTHSPDAVKKLLSLSESKVKTVKSSVSSTSVPLSHLSNSRLNTSSAIVNSKLSSNNIGIDNVSPTAPLSPKTKTRSVSNSQQFNKHLLSNESSGAAAGKLGSQSISSNAAMKLNGASPQVAVAMNSEADSGRASMASNNEQDQSSPTFHQRTSAVNRYEPGTSQSQKAPCKNQIVVNQYLKKSQEMLINNPKNSVITTNQLHKVSNDNINPQRNLEEEEDQVSAV